jgi:hypothetical protein
LCDHVNLAIKGYQSELLRQKVIEVFVQPLSLGALKLSFTLLLLTRL